jgi:glucose/arabinose dehydrogenase
MGRVAPHTLAACLVVGLIGGCQLLPERYAINAPLRNLIWGGGVEAASPQMMRERLKTPDGFSVSLWADDLPNARFLRFTPAGDLLVSQPREGQVTLLERDANGDGKPDGRRVLLRDLDRPHGLDVYDGWLWVAETGAIGRIRFDADTRTTSGTFTRVVTGLPTGGNHWTRTVRVGPDGMLYVSIGSSCNVCIERDRRRAAIVRYRLDGSGEELFATGLRNAVGFDWKPGTNELYATDNGRDLLGDDFPPCELNRVVQGGFYGWPVANGDRVPDPDYGAGQDARIAASIPPAHGFRAHNAPLGMTFVRGTHVPPEYRGAALVALHGSWNRTKKDGYEVVSLHWQPDGTIVERPFLTGFLRNEDVIGRPVDVAEGPDGAFYVSDDYAGAIYRVAFGEAPGGVAVAPSGPRGQADPLAAMPAGEKAARAARGASLYRDLGCATCHEAQAGGAGLVTKPLAGLGARWTVDSLATFLATPTPPMPPVERGPDDRRDLAVHLLATHP